MRAAAATAQDRACMKVKNVRRNGIPKRKCIKSGQKELKRIEQKKLRTLLEKNTNLRT